MRTILVTGGAGFIGSHVAKALITRGNRVVILDNLCTGKKSNVPTGAVFVKGDICNHGTVDSVCKHYKPAAICHIAGLASNINSYTDPVRDATVNYLGTVRVTEACIVHRIPRLIYASTMLIYGPEISTPFREPETAPASYYGISKCAAERFVHMTARRLDVQNHFNATSLRMFNVYGPGQSLTNPYQGVLAIFIGNVLRREPIRIFGSGNQTRDFIYIDDVADTWCSVLDAPESFGRIFNLGTGTQVSINQLAAAVIKACGKNPDTYPIRYCKPRPGDPAKVVADMRLARKVLKLRLRIPFTEGLKKTVAWARAESIS